MYYVYHGYVSPDNYDCSEGPTYNISVFPSVQHVLQFKEDFDESINDECSHVEFRVIEGTERKVTPVEVITKYTLT